MISIENLEKMISEQIKSTEEDMYIFMEHESYTDEEKMYDEGYINALVWVLGMIHGEDFCNHHFHGTCEILCDNDKCSGTEAEQWECAICTDDTW